MGTDTVRSLASLLLASAAFAATPASHAQDIATGLVVIAPTGAVHLYMDRKLAEGATVWVQMPDDKGRARCCEPISVKDLQESTDKPSYTLMASGDHPAHYRWVDSPIKAFSSGFIGIAMAAPNVAAQGRYQLSALHSQPATRAWMCNGTEGVNLLTQSGKHYRSLYLGLGYSFSQRPQCTRRDTQVINQAE